MTREQLRSDANLAIGSTVVGLVLAFIITVVGFEHLYVACNCGSNVRFIGGSNNFEQDLGLACVAIVLALIAPIVNGFLRLYLKPNATKIYWIGQTCLLAAIAGFMLCIMTGYFTDGIRPGCPEIFS